MKFGNVMELVSTISPVELEDSDFLLKTYFVKYPLSMLFCLYTYVVFVLGYTVFVLGKKPNIYSKVFSFNFYQALLPRAFAWRVQNLLRMRLDDLGNAAKLGFRRLYSLFRAMPRPSRHDRAARRLANGSDCDVDYAYFIAQQGRD